MRKHKAFINKKKVDAWKFKTLLHPPELITILHEKNLW